MKTLKLFISISIVFLLGLNTTAQTHNHQSVASIKTETLKVWGNCDMCKNRIEKAVKAEGADNADWNAKTKILKVTFDPSKTNLDKLGKKLASAGHDTEKFKADDKVYNALPGCCKYERNK